jgi:hypothetical protein
MIFKNYTYSPIIRRKNYYFATATQSGSTGFDPINTVTRSKHGYALWSEHAARSVMRYGPT